MTRAPREIPTPQAHNLVRQRGGARAARAGRDFEQRIENQLQVAAASRIIERWDHNEPAYKRTPKGFRPVGAGVADYTAILWGGLSMSVEAKSEGGDRFARSRISDLQVEHLDAVARAGGLALLAVEFRDEDAGTFAEFIVPWRHVPWEVAISARTLTGEALASKGWGVRRPHVFARFIKQCPTCRMAWPAHREPWCCGIKLGGTPHGDLQEEGDHHEQHAEGDRARRESEERSSADLIR